MTEERLGGFRIADMIEELREAKKRKKYNAAATGVTGVTGVTNSITFSNDSKNYVTPLVTPDHDGRNTDDFEPALPPSGQEFVFSDTVKCLGVECEFAVYAMTEGCPVLWCQQEDKEVLYIPVCPQGNWKKNRNNYPIG